MPSGTIKRFLRITLPLAGMNFLGVSLALQLASVAWALRPERSFRR